MPRVPRQYFRTLGVRLSPSDQEKFKKLCNLTEKSPAEMLRTLIRCAEASNVPAVTFAQATAAG